MRPVHVPVSEAAKAGKDIGDFYKGLRSNGVGRHLAAELTIIMFKNALNGGKQNGN